MKIPGPTDAGSGGCPDSIPKEIVTLPEHKRLEIGDSVGVSHPGELLAPDAGLGTPQTPRVCASSLISRHGWLNLDTGVPVLNG